MTSIRFDDRVAIVTGAGGGLGRSHAMLLASRGAKVVVNDLGTSVNGIAPQSPAAQQVVAEIVAAGGTAIANNDDIADPVGAVRLIEQAHKAFGRVDVLINNAGVLRDKIFAKMNLEDFRKIVDVHLMGSVYCTKAVWPHMRAQGYGRVIVTTSSSGLYGHIGQTNYCAAKLGLVGFVKALAQEGTKYGINVNAIAPLAATRMSEGKLDPSGFALMLPEQVSAVVAYLVSGHCGVTGEVFVSGGRYLARAAVVESLGVVLPEGGALPEAVASAIQEARDMTRATAHSSLTSAFDAALQRLGA